MDGALGAAAGTGAAAGAAVMGRQLGLYRLRHGTRLLVCSQNYAVLYLSLIHISLNGVIASLDPESVIAKAEQVALEKVTAAVRAQEDTVRAGVTQAVQQQVTAQVTDAVTAQVQAKVLAGVLTASGLTQEQYDVCLLYTARWV